jgi:hypothetical protein
MVRSQRTSDETILSRADSLDLELLPGLDTILFPDIRREDEAAFGGNLRLHST